MLGGSTDCLEICFRGSRQIGAMRDHPAATLHHFDDMLAIAGRS
jgi:hypothetical protein